MPHLPSGVVTFLFTDIEGSTRLWEEHPEAMHDALTRHNALIRETIEAEDGAVFKTIGDAFCAVFVHAVDAVAAGYRLQQALLAEDWPTPTPLRVRVALHVGDGVVRDGDYFGPALNRVARLLAAGHGGQVLISQAAADLVRNALPARADLRDMGSHRLKDLQQPQRLFQLLHPDLPADFPPLRSLEAFLHNLPVQLTSFIGREREMADVRRLLGTVHLLTLTGSGGCGKTRLALQVAAEVTEEYVDGVWLVELAPLADPALVSQTVASALGVREEPGRPLTATLTEYLRSRALLLVLDNCEHLLGACAQLAESLLRGCLGLRILASSREALGIAGEQVYRVPSLSLPEPGPWSMGAPGPRTGGGPGDPGQWLMTDDPSRPHQPSTGVPTTATGPREWGTHQPSSLMQCEAVRLFVDRAVLSQPAFAVTAANAAAVVQICRRLDGIPLAIELAAARVRALSAEQIAGRLDDRFRLLTGGSRTALPRQQTLRALIDWSYDLLTEAERVLLRRLSVFAGGWTLEAAEAVCPGDAIEEWEVLDLLTALVDKSLVAMEEQESETRYRLLETVRQYAQDRLAESGEADEVRDRHQEFFLALAEEGEPNLVGPEQKVWLDRLEAENGNLRTALAWSLEHEVGERGLRLAGALRWLWRLRGYWSEGRSWLESALMRTEARGHTAARAKALCGVGELAHSHGDPAAARSHLEESVAIWRELGDKSGLASALGHLGWVPLFQGHTQEAYDLQKESLALAVEMDDPREIASALNRLGHVARSRNDWEEARSLFEEAWARCTQLGMCWGIVSAHKSWA